MKLSLFLLILLGIGQPASSSVGGYWPGELAVPEAEVSAVADSDSVSVAVANEVVLAQAFRARSKLNYERQLREGGLFSQQADYRIVQPGQQSRIQTVDFSGSLMYDDVRFKGLDLGIDWIPVCSYLSQTNSGGAATPDTLMSNVEVGPVIRHSLLSVPYSVRGGVYGYAWNNSVHGASSLFSGSSHGDPGAYGEIDVGDPVRPVGALPLYASINTGGRSIRGSNIGRFSGAGLFVGTLPFTGGLDSLFLMAVDSLTNGKELYIGDFDGTSMFSNSAWRINHVFSGMAGLSLAERFGLRPKLYYRYSLHSIAYPSSLQSLDDRRTTRHLFGLGVTSRENGLLTYSGGLEIGSEFEDYLFREHYKSGAIVTGDSRGAMEKNQNDQLTDLARSDQEVRLSLPKGVSLAYEIHATKDSKKYPFFYIDSSFNRKYNPNENDRVQINQQLSTRVGRDSLFYAEVFVQFKKLYDYYYRAALSSRSLSTKDYQVGFNGAFVRRLFECRAQIYSNAEVGDYYFKIVDSVRHAPPPYSRVLNSVLIGKLKIQEDRLHLVGKWVERYSDNGYWYGRAYWPDSGAIDQEYYAIDTKQIQYYIDVAAQLFFPGIQWTLGMSLRDNFRRKYDLDAYAFVNREDIGYGIEPYLNIDWDTDLVQLKVKIRRFINTTDNSRWDPLKNWDLALVMTKEF